MVIFNKKLVILFIILLTIFLAGLVFIYWLVLPKDKLNFNLIKKTEVQEKQNQEQRQELKFLFFGDLMLDRHVGEKIQKNGLAFLFDKLTASENNFFEGYNLISANLEGAVTNQGEHYAPNMSYDFAMAPELIAKLKDYNFNFFNLANNHLSDQGQRGIIETEKNLKNLGFDFSGCADGQTNECTATIIEQNSKKIGLVGLSMVYQKFDQTEAEKIVSELASTTDLVIVNLHWGVEYQHQFNKSQQEVAHNLIDAGADIIIAHHPHVVQGIEIYKGKPIFYSLGNFIFDQYFSADTQQGLAVSINAADGKKIINLFPLKSTLSQVELMAGTEKEKFLENLTGWSSTNDEYKKQIRAGKLEL